MPAWVVPMLATKAGAAFSRVGWIFEPKWDGYRAMCFMREGTARFVSRNQRNLTHRFPELQSIARSIKASSAIIDGEIVAVDEDGVQCFEQLQNHRQDCFTIFFAFDLVFLNGESLTELPLVERKARLKQILPRSQSERIRFTDSTCCGQRGLEMSTVWTNKLLSLISSRVARNADNRSGGNA